MEVCGGEVVVWWELGCVGVCGNECEWGYCFGG